MKLRPRLSLIPNVNLEGRNFGLDVVRAMAILLVLFSHSKAFFRGKSDIPAIYNFSGFYGVELFFILSGFLIGSILIKVYSNTNFSKGDVANFWLRRWIRTLPNYLLVLSVVVVYHYWWHGEIPSVPWYKFYFFIQNFLHFEPNAFGETWSLAVEEWFYISLPVFIFIFISVFDNPSSKGRFFLYAIILYVLLFTAIRYVSMWQNPSYDWRSGCRLVVIYRLDSIGFGVLLAYIYSRNKLAFLNNKFLLIVSIGCILGLYYWYSLEVESMNSASETSSFYFKSIFFTLTSAVTSIFVGCMSHFKNVQFRFICYVSLVSYSMYLIHRVFVLMVMLRFTGRVELGKEYAAYLILFVALSYWASVLLFNNFEYPMTSLRERITHKDGVRL